MELKDVMHRLEKKRAFQRSTLKMLNFKMYIDDINEINYLNIISLMILYLNHLLVIH